MNKLLAVALACAAIAAAAPKKVVLAATDQHPWAVSEAALREFRGASPDIHLVVIKPQQLSGEIADAEGVIGSVTPAQFKTARNLKWVQTFSAGVEAFRWREFIESPVVLTNCKIAQGPTIADHSFAMLLALVRGMHRYTPGRAREEWSRAGAESLVDLGGMTAAVIGVGGIGSQIAQRAHAFGMRVIGVDPKDMPIVPFVSRYVYPDRLDSVLPEADVVFVSAPHTPQSEGMMGARQFELMKKDSYFIAVSRGQLYDTNALVKALDSRRLAGAGLDVTNPEPLPKGHPLWKFDNVIITPHVASQAPNSQARRIAVIKENLGRFARGERLSNIVDKEKGY